MAEDESELELDRLKQELESLLDIAGSDEHGLQSKSYCARFCELVEEHTGRWQVPLPQLQVLRTALCSFVRGAASLPSDCEHVRYTLSSLALSVFELLLFFGKDEFPEDPLKDILDAFQGCHSSLVRHQNVYLLQVRQIIRDGGPWASPVLWAILKEQAQPQDEVERYLGSEVPVFFELRVRYLLACERIQEAMALSRCCRERPHTGRHLFFTQSYLTCLWRASLKERLHKEMADVDGKDAVEILCLMEKEEKEEKDEMLLDLCKGFLCQQLHAGDMYHLWDLIFIWSRLFLQMNPSKDAMLEDCKLMILSAANIKAIFPFMKVILAELGKEGLRFCIELCGRALQTDLKSDPSTKSLIYKTIAYLLPNDLEVCRACALLVFFMERTVESYKTVFLLYTHPDLEYHGDSSPVGNHIRFEVLQILKKDLFFDPEFMNLLNIKTNCLKLMNDEVAKAAMVEMMEDDKWVQNHCTKGPCRCRTDLPEGNALRAATCQSADAKVAVAEVTCLKRASDDVSSVAPPPKRRGRKPGTRLVKVREASPVRRSFRQLDLAQENRARQLSSRHQRLTTRQGERAGLKRRGRKPRWLLLEEAAAQAENSAPKRRGRKPGRKPKRPPEELRTYERLPAAKNKQTDPLKNRPGRRRSDVPYRHGVCLAEEPPPGVPPVLEMLECSLPDNELAITDSQSSPMSSSLDNNGMYNVPHQKAPLQPCGGTPTLMNPVAEVLHRPAAFGIEGDEQVIQRAEDALVVVRQFHTYSKSCEVEGVVLEKQSDVTASPVLLEEVPVEGTVALPEPTESVQAEVEKVVEVSTHVQAEPMEYSLPPEVAVAPETHNETVPRSEAEEKEEFVEPSENEETEELIEPTENGGVPDNVGDISDNHTVDHPRDLDPLPIECTIFEPAASENTTTVTSTEFICSPEISSIEITTSPQTVMHVDTVTEQTQELMAPQAAKGIILPERGTPPPETIHPVLTDKMHIMHCCRLCNKVLKGKRIMRHALVHARIVGKCIFCKNPPGSHPVVHFSLHLNRLKEGKDAGEMETFEIGVTDLSKGSMQDLLRSGLRQRAKKLPELKGRFKRKAVALQSQMVVKYTKKFCKKINGGLARTKHQINKTTARGVPPAGRRHWRRMLGKEKASEKMTKVGEKGINGGTPSSEQEHEQEASVEQARGGEHGMNGEAEAEALEHAENAEVQQEEMDSSHLDERTEQDPKDEPETDNGSNHVTNLNNMPQQEHKEKAGFETASVAAGQNVGSVTDQRERMTMKQEKEMDNIFVDGKCFVKGCRMQFSSWRQFSLLFFHVLNDHPDDRKALENIYNYGKKRCVPCARKLWTVQHFLDHVVCHKGNLRHPCLHMGCTERFKRLGDAREHMKGHKPLRLQCCFPGCTLHFHELNEVYRHERDHYRYPLIRAVKKKLDEAKTDGTVPKVASSETVPEKSDQSPSKPKTDDALRLPTGEAETKAEVVELATKETEKPSMDNANSSSSPAKDPKLVNGHSDGQAAVNRGVVSDKGPSTYGCPRPKPFVRPPPSAYLDESFTSMPKRRKEDPDATQRVLPAKSSSKSSTVSPVTQKRQRCARCLSSFDSEEELRNHLSLKKCTSLFDFDSDEESSTWDGPANDRVGAE